MTGIVVCISRNKGSRNNEGFEMVQVKPMILQESHFKNESDESVEFMIPVNERVRVNYDQERFSYVVESTEAEQQSVVLMPGDSLEQL